MSTNLLCLQCTEFCWYFFFLRKTYQRIFITNTGRVHDLEFNASYYKKAPNWRQVFKHGDFRIIIIKTTRCGNPQLYVSSQVFFCCCNFSTVIKGWLKQIRNSFVLYYYNLFAKFSTF